MSEKKLKIFEIDPYLLPYERDIALRLELYNLKRAELIGKKGNIVDFADGYK